MRSTCGDGKKSRLGSTGVHGTGAAAVAATVAIAAVCLLLIAPAGEALATDVGGTILVDQTWTAGGNPYVIVNDFSVAQGVTLRILPGVAVQFQPGTYLLVGGKLVARGTAESPISFTSTGANRLIMFQNSAVDATYDGGGQYVDGCILEYVRLDNVGVNAAGVGPYFNRVDVSNGDIAVSNADKAYVVDSTLTGSSNHFYAESVGETLMRDNYVTGGALDAKWTTGTITGNYILNGYGIRAGGGWTSQQYTITDNIIVGSGAIGSQTRTNLGETMAATQVIADNLVYRSYWPEVAIDAVAQPAGGPITSTVRNNIVAESTIAPSSDHAAIRVANSADEYTFVVEYNSVVDNHFVGSSGGFGVYATSHHNLVRRNTAVGNWTDAVSKIGYGGFGVDGYLNLFEHNNVYGNDIYALFNYSTPGSTVTATSNHWGTTNSVELNALIYDSNDDISVGPVVYQPVLERPDPDAPVPPPISFAVTPVDGGLHLGWDKVRASDITGYVVYYDTDNDAFPYEGQDANEGQSPVRLGDVGEYTLTGLDTGKSYYVAVTAYDTADNTSLPLLKNQLAGHHSWYSKIESEVVYPIADFGVPFSQMNAGEPFQFNDASLGTVTGRLWEFGDGGTSTETNPAHTYVDQGTFSVTLTVTGPGGTDSEVKQNYVTIVRRPTTTLHTNPTSPNGHDEYYTVIPEIGLVPDETATTWIQWDTTSGAWSQYSTTTTALEGSHRLYYYSVDLGSLEETPAQYHDFKVDTIVPQDPLVSSPSHYADSVSLDRTVDMAWVGATDPGSGVDGFSVLWDNASSTVPDDTKDFEETADSTTSAELAYGAWYFHLRTGDAAGNWTSTVHVGPFYIGDTTPPVTTLETYPASGDGLNDWYRSNTYVGLHRSEPGTTAYQWDATSGAWGTYSTTLVVSEGDHTLYYYSYDTSSNTEATRGTRIKVDTYAPIKPALWTTDGHTQDAPSNDNTIDIALADATDAASGVDGFSATWDNTSAGLVAEVKNMEETVNATTSPPLADGVWWFLTRTVDNAGNWSGKQEIGPFTIDTSAPVTTAAVTPGADGDDGWHKTAPSVVLSRSSAGTTKYRWDSATWETYSTTLTVAESDHTLYYYSTDTANNTETVRSVSTKVDVTPPLDPTTLVTSHTADSVSNDNTIDVSWLGATDLPSGVGGYSISWTPDVTATPDTTVDAGSAEYSATSDPLADGTWWVNLRTKDVAGNWTATVHTGPFHIDTQAPSASMSTAMAAFTASPTRLDVRWGGADPAPASGIATYNVARGMNTSALVPPPYWQTDVTYTAASFNPVDGATYTFRVQGTDLAGNAGGWSMPKTVVVPFDQSVFTYSGRWSGVRHSGLYGGTARASSVRGAYAAYRFTGAKEVYLLVTKKPTGGYVDIYFGTSTRRAMRIDLYSKNVLRQVKVRIATYVKASTNKLRVAVAGLKRAASKGTSVEVDGVAAKR